MNNASKDLYSVGYKNSYSINRIASIQYLFFLFCLLLNSNGFLLSSKQSVDKFNQSRMKF